MTLIRGPNVKKSGWQGTSPTKRVLIKYHNPPRDEDSITLTNPQGNIIPPGGEYFYEPDFKKCALCKKSLGKLEESLADVLSFKVRHRFEFVKYNTNDDEQAAIKIMETNLNLPDPYENMFTSNSNTTITTERYDRLAKKSITYTTQGFQPHICLTCFREETEQTHEWFDIAPPTNWNNVVFKGKKIDKHKYPEDASFDSQM